MSANTKAIFQEMFANFQDYYVLIGGTATSIILDSQGFKSRTTKDYDMVIIDELKNKEFYDTLNHFLESTPSCLPDLKLSLIGAV